ncbi:MAG: solute:sodium symporter family transporter [Butyricicoccus sp.]|nr:solute:sodium symporter family transporter [Butyricicoccus sp.]MBQ8585181.1 solute:sodium symporter family transporter [Butyricicoccus sp.]
MLWTVITFVFFTVLVAVISYVKTKGDDQTSAEGYFLAGRGLPGFVIAGSLLLTNISAEQLVGTNGQTWASNMSGMAFEVVAAIACILLALYAAPKYLKSGVATVPQMIGIRYDRITKLWFSIAYIALYLIVQIPLILYAGALVLENIFGISVMFGITKFQAVIAVCIATSIIGSIYAICGGLKAVAVSDTVNGVLLIVGGFAIPFVALHVLGQATGSEGFAMIDGFKFLVENYPQKLNSISPANAMPPEVPWPTVFTGLAFLCIQSWCTHQSFIQRVLAAKDLKEAQKGALYCAFMKILGFLYLALPGVIAYALFEVQGTQISVMDDAYPQLIAQVVPGPLMGFFAAVMFGAIISSFNSFLNSVNTMFTMDIYADFINPKASQEKLVKVGKNVGLLFAVLSTAIGPMIYFFPGGVKTFLDSLTMLIGLPVLSAVFGGFFFKYLPKCSAKVVLVFHIIFYGAFLLFIKDIHYLYAISLLLPVEILIMYIMNVYNKKNHPELGAWAQEDVQAVDLTPWKYRKVAAAIVVVGVLIVYAAFSPLGFGA